MSRDVRVALIGAGPAGQAHAFGYRNMAMSERLRGTRVILDTVVDPNLDLARSVADRYGFQRAVADVEALMGVGSFDAASVALPNFLTAPTVSRLLAAGKHVLSEKPLGLSAVEASTLTSEARAAGLIAGVGFSYRRIPALAAARAAVAQGCIGVPLSAVATFYSDYALDPEQPLSWRYVRETSGGGTLLDMGTHALDALEFLVGPIAEVTAAHFDTRVETRPLVGRPGERGAVDTDDIASLLLRFDGGATGTMVTSRVAAGVPLDLSVEVFGSNGHVRWRFSDMNRYWLYEGGSHDSAVDGARVVQAGPASPHFNDVQPMAFHGNATGYGEAFIAEIQDFVGAIVTGAPMDTDFEAATRTMKVAEAAYKSATEQRPVRLER